MHFVALRQERKPPCGSCISTEVCRWRSAEPVGDPELRWSAGSPRRAHPDSLEKVPSKGKTAAIQVYLQGYLLVFCNMLCFLLVLRWGSILDQHSDSDLKMLARLSQTTTRRFNLEIRKSFKSVSEIDGPITGLLFPWGILRKSPLSSLPVHLHQEYRHTYILIYIKSGCGLLEKPVCFSRKC